MVIDDLYTEAKTLSKTIQDISNFRYKYKINNIYFDSLKISVLEDYYQYLKANSEYKRLDPKYYYKPEYLSLDESGTPKFWELLLFVNNCFCIEDFKMPNVFIPYYDAIFEVIKNHIPNSQRTIELKKLELK